MKGFNLLKEKTGQELISVLRDGEDLILGVNDGTWLKIKCSCSNQGNELYIE